jgi:hypothetical protein
MPASLDSLRDRANFGVASELGAQKMLSAGLPTTAGWLWGVRHSERGEAATQARRLSGRGQAFHLRLSDFGSALTGQPEMFRFTQHDRRVRDARLPHRLPRRIRPVAD